MKQPGPIPRMIRGVHRMGRFNADWFDGKHIEEYIAKIAGRSAAKVFARAADKGDNEHDCCGALLPPGPGPGPRSHSPSLGPGPIGDSDMPSNAEHRAADALKWFQNHTSYTRNGATPYEQAIDALTARMKSRHGTLTAPEPDEAPTLTERQAQTLYLIASGNRELVNAKRNAKVIEALIDLGVLNEWREITDLGKVAGHNYRRNAK